MLAPRGGLGSSHAVIAAIPQEKMPARAPNTGINRACQTMTAAVARGRHKTFRVGWCRG